MMTVCSPAKKAQDKTARFAPNAPGSPQRHKQLNLEP